MMIELNLNKNHGKIYFKFHNKGLNLVLENFDDGGGCGVFLNENQAAMFVNKLNHYKQKFLPTKKPPTSARLDIIEKVTTLIHELNYINDFEILKFDLKKFLETLR